jgi:MFS family permease
MDAASGSDAATTRNTKRHWTPVVLLETANLTSGVANASVLILLPWLVLQITGSPFSAGLVAAISSVLGGIASPIAGILIDRIGRRAVSIGSDILSAVSVGAIPFVALLTDLSFTWILVLAALGAAFDPSGYTARKTLITDAATASRMNIAKLNGIHEGLFAVGWTVGPVLAAGLIATVGAITAFWAPFVLFIIASIAVTFMRVADAGQESLHGMGPESFWASTVRGMRVLWADRPLRAITIAIMVIAAVYLPTESIILPVFFEAKDLPQGLGLVIAAMAGGTMVGAFGFGWLSNRMTRYTLGRLVLAGTMVSMVPLALLPPLPIMIAAGFLLGLSWGPMQPLLNTIVQRRVAPDAQGRVFGVQMAAFYAGPPVAMLIVGAAVGAIGLQVTYLILAGLVVLTAGITIFVPSIRQIND